MGLLLTQTAAPADLFTLAEAKEQIGIFDSDRDSMIAGFITTVSQRLDGPDGDLCRALAPQTWAYSHHAKARAPGGVLPLPIGPARTITGFTYYDRDNAQQSGTIADFTLYSTQRGNAWIEPKPNKEWPESYNRPDAITITYDAGEAAIADIPAAIIHAAKLMVTDLFELRSTRERNAYKNTGTYENMLAGFRSWAA